jgi:hypothetical protein
MNVNNYCFSVNYYKDDGTLDEVVQVKKVPRAKLRDLIVNQQTLLHRFVENDACVGDTLVDESTWNLIKATAAMLPLVGREDETLNVERFCEDYIQIGRIFFTESIKDNGDLDLKDSGFLPSRICRLHQLNYGNMVGKAVEAYQEKTKSRTKRKESNE